MCGPIGTAFCGVLSLFGAVFMAALAIMIGKDYQYLGEWFDTSTNSTTHEILVPYSDQKSTAVTNCWVVGAVYLVVALVCGLGMVYHRLRRNI